VNIENDSDDMTTVEDKNEKTAHYRYRPIQFNDNQRMGVFIRDWSGKKD
jgi:hypothetical protein